MLDILINNVGTNIRKGTVDYTPEEFHKVIDTNLNSVFLLTQASIYAMLGLGLGIIFYILYSGFPHNRKSCPVTPSLN